MQQTGAIESVEAWTRHRPWIPDGLLALGLAVLALPTSAVGIWQGGWPLAGRLLVTALLVLAHLSLVVRRVFPRVAFGAVAALLFGMVASPDLGASTAEQYDGSLPAILLPSAAIFFVALYSVAAWSDPRNSLVALTIGMAGAVMTCTRVIVGGGVEAAEATAGWWPLVFCFGCFASVVASWSLGRFRRLRTQYVEALEERARLEDENRERRDAELLGRERSRIAREMHDVVSHSLAVMVSQAEGGRMMAAKDASVTLPVLETVARTGQEAMRGMRGILDALDPERAAAQATPQPTLGELPALLDRVRDAGLDVDLERHGDVVPLDAQVELAAYRVVQEALTNVLKHGSSVEAARVSLVGDPHELRVVVRDDGDRPTRPPGQGRGITGMRERVGVLGGVVVAEHDGTGFVVTARIPARGGRE